MLCTNGYTLSAFVTYQIYWLLLRSQRNKNNKQIRIFYVPCWKTTTTTTDFSTTRVRIDRICGNFFLKSRIECLRMRMHGKCYFWCVVFPTRAVTSVNTNTFRNTICIPFSILVFPNYFFFCGNGWKIFNVRHVWWRDEGGKI